MKAFQLKIAIKNSKPPIWRRVIVPAGITFSQLSMILNEAMGWSGSHLFEFEFYYLQLKMIEGANEDTDYGYISFDIAEASEIYIREYLEENDWFTYTYDFGDKWAHRVTIEKIIPDYEWDYPQVIKYKGDCPIEDCGGIEGYYECLEIVENPQHPEYKERLEWMQLQGYPCEYNMESVNERLKEQFFYKWGKGEKRFQEEIYKDIFTGKFGLHATKQDQNTDVEIIQSRKHKLDAEMERMLEKLRQYCMTGGEQKEVKLKTIFQDYNKSDIMEIAKQKGIRGISNDKKEKIIDKLTTKMLQPDVIEAYFCCLQDEELKAFEGCANRDKDYIIHEENHLVKLCETSYAGLLTDGTVVIPKDVVDIYEKLKGREFEEKRKKMSYFLSCLRTTEILYGIVPVSVFQELLKKNSGMHMSEKEIEAELEKLPVEFRDYVLEQNSIYHKELYLDDLGLLAAQGNKEYYIPTKQEILEIGREDHLPSNPFLKEFKNFLVQSMNVSLEKAELVGKTVQMEICRGGEMQDVFDIIEEFKLGIENQKQLNDLVQHINNLWNDTRMLLNRGFTPNEIHVTELNYMQPILSSDNIINFQAVRKQKIYPNEPCPCGSGKKYKKCCMKR